MFPISPTPTNETLKISLPTPICPVALSSENFPKVPKINFLFFKLICILEFPLKYKPVSIPFPNNNPFLNEPLAMTLLNKAELFPHCLLLNPIDSSAEIDKISDEPSKTTDSLLCITGLLREYAYRLSPPKD